MVKIALVVFSMALVLSVQFVVGQDEQKEEVEEVTPEQEEAIFYFICGTIMDYMGNTGLADPKVLKTDQAMEEVKKAYEMGKATEKAAIDKKGGELTTEEEKDVLHQSIEYLIRGLGKTAGINADAVHKAIFPDGVQNLSPKVEEVMARAIEAAALHGLKTPKDL